MKPIPNDFGFGGIGLTDWLPAIIKGLLAPSVVVVAGAAANTNIVVAGMTATSQVISVVAFPASGAPVVVPVTVQSNGNIQSTVATTGDNLVVTFLP